MRNKCAKCNNIATPNSKAKQRNWLYKITAKPKQAKIPKGSPMPEDLAVEIRNLRPQSDILKDILR